MYTNTKVKGIHLSYYPMGINEKNGTIPCTQVANNLSSQEIVENIETDAYFFRGLEEHGIKLNQKQIEAVRSIEGPVITIAGAGSGKTSVLTSRVGYMITEKQIHPGNIMIHRFIKKRIRPILGLKSLRTAKRIIAGIEAMHMIKKGQTLQREKSVQNQKEFIHKLFGLAS